MRNINKQEVIVEHCYKIIFDKNSRMPYSIKNQRGIKTLDVKTPMLIIIGNKDEKIIKDPSIYYPLIYENTKVNLIYHEELKHFSHLNNSKIISRDILNFILSLDDTNIVKEIFLSS